jgi:hypothetical protein
VESCEVVNHEHEPLANHVFSIGFWRTDCPVLDCSLELKKCDAFRLRLNNWTLTKDLVVSKQSCKVENQYVQ